MNLYMKNTAAENPAPVFDSQISQENHDVMRHEIIEERENISSHEMHSLPIGRFIEQNIEKYIPSTVQYQPLINPQEICQDNLNLFPCSSTMYTQIDAMEHFTEIYPAPVCDPRLTETNVDVMSYEIEDEQEWERHNIEKYIPSTVLRPQTPSKEHAAVEYQNLTNEEEICQGDLNISPCSCKMCTRLDPALENFTEIYSGPVSDAQIPQAEHVAMNDEIIDELSNSLMVRNSHYESKIKNNNANYIPTSYNKAPDTQRTLEKNVITKNENNKFLVDFTIDHDTGKDAEIQNENDKVDNISPPVNDAIMKTRPSVITKNRSNSLMGLAKETQTGNCTPLHVSEYMKPQDEQVAEDDKRPKEEYISRNIFVDTVSKIVVELTKAHNQHLKTALENYVLRYCSSKINNPLKDRGTQYENLIRNDNANKARQDSQKENITNRSNIVNNTPTPLFVDQETHIENGNSIPARVSENLKSQEGQAGVDVGRTKTREDYTICKNFVDLTADLDSDIVTQALVSENIKSQTLQSAVIDKKIRTQAQRKNSSMSRAKNKICNNCVDLTTELDSDSSTPALVSQNLKPQPPQSAIVDKRTRTQISEQENMSKNRAQNKICNNFVDLTIEMDSEDISPALVREILKPQTLHTAIVDEKTKTQKTKQKHISRNRSEVICTKFVDLTVGLDTENRKSQAGHAAVTERENIQQETNTENVIIPISDLVSKSLVPQTLHAAVINEGSTTQEAQRQRIPTPDFEQQQTHTENGNSAPTPISNAQEADTDYEGIYTRGALPEHMKRRSNDEIYKYLVDVAVGNDTDNYCTRSVVNTPLVYTPADKKIVISTGCQNLDGIQRNVPIHETYELLRIIECAAERSDSIRKSINEPEEERPTVRNNNEDAKPDHIVTRPSLSSNNNIYPNTSFYHQTHKPILVKRSLIRRPPQSVAPPSSKRRLSIHAPEDNSRKRPRIDELEPRPFPLVPLPQILLERLPEVPPPVPAGQLRPVPLPSSPLLSPIPPERSPLPNKSTKILPAHKKQ